MRIVGTEHDLLDRFDVVVDEDADPVDLDQALAEFLLSYVRSTAGASPEIDRNQSEANEVEKW